VLSLASRLVSMRQLRALEASHVPLPPPPVQPPHPWAEDDVQLQLDRLVRQQRQQQQQEEPIDGYDGEAAAAFAAQTLHVFVPIAHRLGMWFFKTELEELCFATLQPDAFRELSASLRTARQGVHRPGPFSILSFSGVWGARRGVPLAGPSHGGST
jgi:hypothetical protein